MCTVPEGAEASVRLGNWTSNSSNPEAESVTYSLFVDPSSFDLLILKYAAVLQDPEHSAAQQPRFSIEILNEYNELIDSRCGAADFIANANLGWNEAANDVLWKDWTTVGLDMSAYANQTIRIRLTTYDCGEGSHYGYAYFTLDCLLKNIRAEYCGEVESNIFTMPDGFNYNWYTDTVERTTLYTTQSINIPTSNTTYYCDVSFVDNAECFFTMSAYAGTRYPLALFDSVITLNNCQFYVQFNNLSTISTDHHAGDLRRNVNLIPRRRQLCRHHHQDADAGISFSFTVACRPHRPVCRQLARHGDGAERSFLPMDYK